MKKTTLTITLLGICSPLIAGEQALTVHDDFKDSIESIHCQVEEEIKSSATATHNSLCLLKACGDKTLAVSDFFENSSTDGDASEGYAALCSTYASCAHVWQALLSSARGLGISLSEDIELMNATKNSRTTREIAFKNLTEEIQALEKCAHEIEALQNEDLSSLCRHPERLYTRIPSLNDEEKQAVAQLISLQQEVAQNRRKLHTLFREFIFQKDRLGYLFNKIAMAGFRYLEKAKVMACHQDNFKTVSDEFQDKTLQAAYDDYSAVRKKLLFAAEEAAHKTVMKNHITKLSSLQQPTYGNHEDYHKALIRKVDKLKNSFNQAQEALLKESAPLLEKIKKGKEAISVLKEPFAANQKVHAVLTFFEALANISPDGELKELSTFSQAVEKLATAWKDLLIKGDLDMFKLYVSTYKGFLMNLI